MQEEDILSSKPLLGTTITSKAVSIDRSFTKRAFIKKLLTVWLIQKKVLIWGRMFEFS